MEGDVILRAGYRLRYNSRRYRLQKSGLTMSILICLATIWRQGFLLGVISLLSIASCASLFAEEASPSSLLKEQPAQGRFVKTARGFMVPYQMQIPGSDVTFYMEPIPGGRFTMGSPADEPNRKEDEGPQLEVELPPFWMSRYEVTWAEYKQYMALHDVFRRFEEQKIRKVTEERALDAVTAPSRLYDPDTTFRSGDDPNQPAVMMTQYAAKQYTKWLSGVTGDFYRLPTEAEWEYACRASTSTAFSFGDDANALEQYAWYSANADDRTHKVGQKRPNPWGLYDMHGNAAEWVLDEYTPEGYARPQGESTTARDAFQVPTKLFPRVLRGGSFELPARTCRSAARLASDDEAWKTDDPNLPASPWWFTTAPATGVGFRIMRPLQPPNKVEEREQFWRADVEEIREDVELRIYDQDSGAIGIVDRTLPQAMRDLKK